MNLQQRHLGFVPQAHEDYDAFVPTLSAPESLDWTTEADHVSPIQRPKDHVDHAGHSLQIRPELGKQEQT
eukprot:gnl/Chilomastix_caulleri/5267.p1 GENE.gnl/Chilomastix_caulleri/5267~~gnl/Chilomastix_caulleri/5267.p1  ORF type:complete len:70 (-),score=19.55 gnl/Chilomastix_caulleri/5267:42-251(-)